VRESQIIGLCMFVACCGFVSGFAFCDHLYEGWTYPLNPYRDCMREESTRVQEGPTFTKEFKIGILCAGLTGDPHLSTNSHW
jgi:hypothetical protein